jgi:peptidyl-Asp metalloendopeptidase
MQHKIKFLFIISIAVFACSQKGYSQKSLVARQVDKNTFARKQTGKDKVISYLQQRSKNGVVNLFEFNADVLKDDAFFLNVFPGELIKVSKQKVDKRSGDNFTWYGVINGTNGHEGSIAMVYLNGELSGNLNYKSGNYSMTPMGKGAFSLYEIDFKKAPVDDDAPGMMDSHEKISKQGEPATEAAAAAACNLRVLIAITPSAESFIKNSLGFSSLTQFALQAVAETNQAYINSAVNIYMELASSVRVNYSESGNFSTDLTRFRTTSDGYMDEIHNYRNLYAADVNLLIINNSSACGLASTIMANATTAFAAAHYDCTLGYYSFAHEIGHLQGLRHNPEVDGSTSPYAYGHGYVYSPGGWRTVMAYNYNGETRIQYFSNPNVTYGGVAMGTAGTHNNARVLNETAGTVANFRNTSSTLAINSAGSVVNDESSDAIATSEVILQDGFEATGSSQFSARIISCVGPSIAADNTDAVNVKEDESADSRSALVIYPTVTSGRVFISTDHSVLKRADIIVTDNSGRIVLRSVNNAGRKTISMNLGHLPNGIYFIQAKQGEKVITRKVIINH